MQNLTAALQQIADAIAATNAHVQSVATQVATLQQNVHQNRDDTAQLAQVVQNLPQALPGAAQPPQDADVAALRCIPSDKTPRLSRTKKGKGHVDWTHSTAAAVTLWRRDAHGMLVNKAFSHITAPDGTDVFHIDDGYILRSSWH